MAITKWPVTTSRTPTRLRLVVSPDGACPLCGRAHPPRPFAGDVRFSLTPKGQAWLEASRRRREDEDATHKEGC